jgi:hypothetical protein
MEKLIAGLLLPCGSGVVPEPVLVNGLDSLNMMVEGTIDAVTTTLGTDGDAVIVGYINDEGLILDLEFNYIASALFGREIVGNCVAVWGLNENGVYDGESYDLPSDIVDFINNQVMQTVATGYGTASILACFCDVAMGLGIANEDDVEYHSEQLMLSAQMGNIDGDHDAHIDYFINMIHDVLLHSETVENDIDGTIREWGEMVIGQLETRKA